MFLVSILIQFQYLIIEAISLCFKLNFKIIVLVAITKLTFLHCDLLADGCDIFFRVSSEHLSFPVNPSPFGLCVSPVTTLIYLN